MITADLAQWTRRHWITAEQPFVRRAIDCMLWTGPRKGAEHPSVRYVYGERSSSLWRCHAVPEMEVVLRRTYSKTQGTVVLGYSTISNTLRVTMASSSRTAHRRIGVHHSTIVAQNSQLFTSAKEDIVVCLYVCLSPGVCLLATLRRKFRTDLHEIFREGWQWINRQTITFWWRSGSPSRHSNCFPDSSLLGDKESG